MAIILIVSLFTNALVIGAEENDYSLDVSVTHNTSYDGDGDEYTIWGNITITNNGDAPAYVSSIGHLVQSEHARWVTLKSQTDFSAGSVDDAIVIDAGDSYTVSYTMTFYPEEGTDTYRHRVIVDVFTSAGSTTKFFSDNTIVLDTENNTPQETSAPATTAPPTTTAPTTAAPTPTAPTTTAPTTTAPATTAPATEEPQADTSSSDDDAMMISPVRGAITNIETDITNGGYAVLVQVTVMNGWISRSSLYLTITSKSGEWEKIYADSMNIQVAGGLTQWNTPLTFCFEDIKLSGDIEDYVATVVWKQGYIYESGPIISRQTVNFHTIPAIDIVTYGVIFATIAAIASVAVYIKKNKKG